MNLDPSFWMELLARLSLGVLLVVLFAYGFSLWRRSAVWTRSVWRASMLGIFLLLGLELTGAGRGTWTWFFAKDRADGQAFSARSLPIPLAEDSAAGNGNVFSARSKRPVGSPSLSSRVWPGVLWFGVSCGLLMRSVGARVWIRHRWSRCPRVGDSALVQRAQQWATQLGVRSLRLIEVEGLAGPVAFGVMRSTVGLPRRFSDDFNPQQQEAMLAHELAHHAVHDPAWYAFADAVCALLWWHPLVWMARRSLHAASEDAADESSVLIQEGPQLLAECLVAVGRRLTQCAGSPMIGVGGTGLKSGLARRVRRLLEISQTPLQPISVMHLWSARLCVAAAFFSVGWVCSGWQRSDLPAGRTPNSAWQGSLAGRAFAALSPEKTPIGSSPSSKAETKPAPSKSQPPEPTSPSSVQRATEVALDAIRMDDVDFNGLSLSAAAEKIATKANALNSRGTMITLLIMEDTVPIGSRIVNTLVPLHQVSLRTVLDALMKSAPGVALEYQVQSDTVVIRRRQTASASLLLDTILMDDVDFNGLTLEKAVERIVAKTKAMDPKGVGINIVFLEDTVPIRSQIVNTPVPLQQVALRVVMDTLMKAVPGTVLEYQAESYAVVIRRSQTPALHTRTYRLNQDVLGRVFGAPAPGRTLTQEEKERASGAFLAIKTRFERLGADFTPPKQVFLNGQGLLMVRGNLKDLEIVERIVNSLNQEQAQVVLETKFIEISEDAAVRVGLYALLGQNPDEDIDAVFLQKPSAPVSFTMKSAEAGAELIPSRPLPEATVLGVISADETKRLLKAMEVPGINVLAAPKLLTLSQRQCEIKIADTKTVITGMDRSDPASPRPLSETFPQGPILSIVPTVGTNDVSIRLDLAGQLSTFLGYESAIGLRAEPDADPRPRIRVLQAQAAASLQDNQTFIFSLGHYEENNQSTRSKLKKSVFVFVTPTLVDAAGNRVHPSR